MKTTTKKGGKKNRKIGRWSRSPSNKRYVSEGHRDKNKRERIAKEAAIKAAHAEVRRLFPGSVDVSRLTRWIQQAGVDATRKRVAARQGQRAA